jgi:hypothetical protein
MAVGDFSEWINNFSLDEILRGNFSGFLSLFILIIIIAIYSIAIFHFYRFIARRDCFKPSKGKHTKTISFLKYFFLFPFVAVLFFLGFSLMLIFLTKGDTYNIPQLLTTAFAIIVAIRITAYYSEDLSRDVAKMLPFAMLGIFLIDPTYYTIEAINQRFEQFPANVNSIIQFLLLLILVEWILRIALTIRYAISPKKEKLVVEER